MKLHLIIICFGLIGILSACGSRSERTAETTQDQDAPGEWILLSEAQYAQAGIELGSFTNRSIEDYLTANAELFLSPEYLATASTITDGIVSELRVSLNQRVRKGEVLAMLHKPNLLDMQQEWLQNQERLAFLKAEYERYAGLAAENATAARNLEKAQADWREAQSAQAVLAAKLRQLQIAPEQISATQLKTQLPLRAPIDGTVTQLLVGPGAALKAGDALCHIADYSQVQPVIYAFEKDVPRIRTGMPVKLHFAGDTSRTFEARIASIDGSLDPEHKTLRALARWQGKAPEGLVAGVYLQAHVQAGGGQKPVSALPQQAVVRESDGEYIFVLEQRNQEGYWFRKIAVQTGGLQEGYIAVHPLEDVPVAARVVVKGAYYVSAQGSGIAVEE